MTRAPPISLRVKVPPALYAKISEFRWAARHESRNTAMLELLNAGLIALSQPVTMPAPSPTPKLSNPTTEALQRGERRKLVTYAGRDQREKALP